MSNLLEMILSGDERIIPLYGLHGVGKSALARNTLHYVAERKLCTGGILLIQLKNYQSNFSLIKQIMQ